MTSNPDLPPGAAPDATDPLRATEADVVHAYRFILRREPDPEGLAYYRRRVREGWLRTDLIGQFMGSDEYFDLMQRDRFGSEAVVDLGGYSVVVNLTETAFGRHIHAQRQYEEPVRQVVRDHVRPGDVCLDVGANVGVITLLAASLVGPSGRVVAVEPSPDNVHLLYRGLVVNGFTNVDVLPLAASDRRQVVSLAGRTSNNEVAPVTREYAGGRLTQTAVLDDLLAGLPRLDFVKMDVEGHEPAALRGLWRLVTRLGPTLLVEFNPRCLVIQGEDPIAYLDQILSRYPALRVISPFGDDETFTSASGVMGHWQRRDRELTAQGALEPGLLHFDLVARLRG